LAKSVIGWIVLQNSRVAAVQIFGENLKRKEVDDSHSFNRATEVAHEFDYRPEHDATVVTRLREAGAVLLGKLKLTEGAFAAHHPSIDPPINPWSAEHWTGVSSSGSGVATASGLCYGSLGTDTLGSIRFPSTMNGVTGLKPTWGRVSGAGVFALAQSMDHIGPMARTAADTAAMLGAIAGPDPDDPTAVHEPVPDYLVGISGGVRGLRIGLDRALIAAGADTDMVNATEEAAAVLARDGALLRDVRCPSTDAVVPDALALCGVEAAVAHDATYPSRGAEYGPVLTGFLETGRALDGLAVAKIWHRREAFRGQLNALFRDIDLLIMPAMDRAAPTLADIARRSPAAVEARIRFTAPFDLEMPPNLLAVADEVIE
jgi:amidase